MTESCVLSILRVTPDLGEVLGVLLGDGCVFKYSRNGEGIYGVALTGSESEFWYYRDFVQPVFEAEFGVHGRLVTARDHTTRYKVYSGKLVSSFADIGIPIGKKRDAAIPKVVLESGRIVPFIRGLHHAEGSIYRRYSKRYNRHARIYSNLLVIQVRMKLKTLMRQVCMELENMGILTNRLTEKEGVLTLRITKQDNIVKFLDMIGPRYKLAPRQPFNPQNQAGARGPVAQPG